MNYAADVYVSNFQICDKSGLIVMYVTRYGPLDAKNVSSSISLRKHTCLNILKILQPEKENFQIKILIFFIFLLKT